MTICKREQNRLLKYSARIIYLVQLDNVNISVTTFYSGIFWSTILKNAIKIENSFVHFKNTYEVRYGGFT